MDRGHQPAATPHGSVRRSSQQQEQAVLLAIHWCSLHSIQKSATQYTKVYVWHAAPSLVILVIFHNSLLWQRHFCFWTTAGLATGRPSESLSVVLTHPCQYATLQVDSLQPLVYKGCSVLTGPQPHSAAKHGQPHTKQAPCLYLFG